MRDNTARLVVVFICVGALVATGLCSFSAEAGESADKAMEIASIGKPAVDAIGLKAWTNKEPGEVFRTGDRVIIDFQSDRAGHLAIIAASSSGDVMVLFPYEEMRVNTIQKGKLYTLFGDDSRIWLKLGKKIKAANLTFYVSSKPFTLDPLKPAEGQGCIFIKSDSKAQMEILRKKLESLSENKGFNRVVLPLKGSAGEGFDIKVQLMGQTNRGLKRLPSSVESEVPGAVTGAQGLKKKTKIKE